MERPQLFSQQGYISAFLILLFVAGVILAGTFTALDTRNPTIGVVVSTAPNQSDTSLQLHTVTIISATPTPTGGIPTQTQGTIPPTNPTATPTQGTAPPPGTSSLLCGTNLGLFDDTDWVTNTGAQASLAKLHVSTIRIPWRAGKEDPTGSRLIKSVQIAHALGVIPMVILPSETSFASQDKQIIGQINTIMNGSQVFYELGNEVFDNAYLGKWNQIIPQLKPIAINSWFGGPVAMLNAGPGATTSMAQFYVNAKPTPDFLDWHEYTCGHTDSAQYCFDHVANAPGHNWGQHIQDTQKALQTLGVPTMPKVFITEWNYDSAARGVSPGDPRLPTLNSMHFVTTALKELKAIGVYAAYHYVLDTNIDYNLINYNGSTITGEGQDFQATCANL